MFGPGLMVAPVTRKGAALRTVYLPGTTDWYDFWTGKRMAAKQTIAAAAPIDTMPLFVRAGTILPLGPVVGYAEAQTGAPLELRIYRGADGHFALYDDNGDGWGYEKGQRAIVEITWNEATGTLTFAARQGQFPGMKRAREFHIVWGGAGDAETKTFQTVVYKGKRLVIKAP
jgi:alpha-D-xyloside xylohydrolase